MGGSRCDKIRTVDTLPDFVTRLIEKGVVMIQGPPECSAAGRRNALRVLEEIFAGSRLDVAGPPISFDRDAALAAAQLVEWATWYLVQRADLAEDVERRVRMPGAPASPAAHLSADLALRYLPQVHGRARAVAPDDALTRAIEATLRQWPLSGVLADVAEPPTSPLDFGGHAGLMLLYAERLSAHERPGWVPTGRTAEYVELVWQESGRAAPVALTRTEGDAGD